jgi:uncharacterized protein YbaR (Trm112 family)
LFIELTEILRCPNGHPESYVVATPIAMDGRRIVRGVVGCPECQAEFPIIDGVAYFGVGGAGGDPGGPVARPPVPDYDATALAAFLNLSGPGGYAVLAGAAARFAAAVVAAVPGVHFVAVNAPPGVAPAPMLSLLRDPRGFPLRSASVRGAALGADVASEPWLGEAARVLLPGLRLVIEDEGAAPAGVTELARGGGMFVGVRGP